LLDPQEQGLAAHKGAAAEADNWNWLAARHTSCDGITHVGLGAMEKLRDFCHRQQAKIMQ
jgi:hypothetical protein